MKAEWAIAGHRLLLKMASDDLGQGVRYEDQKIFLVFLQCIYHLPDGPRLDLHTINPRSEGTPIRTNYRLAGRSCNNLCRLPNHCPP